MNDPQVGWIAAIIIGGVAGWLAEQFMKGDMGLVMNIVLGVIGAAVASAIFSFFGINMGGGLGYLIAGFVGACLLIWIVRTVRGATAQCPHPVLMRQALLSFGTADLNQNVPSIACCSWRLRILDLDPSLRRTGFIN